MTRCIQFSLLLGLASMVIPASVAAAADGPTIRNPIIRGDWSDPALIKVGDDFYTCRSTFGWQPGIPIAHSRDLVHWRVIGHAFDSRDDIVPGDTRNGIWGLDMGFNPNTRRFLIYAPMRNHSIYVYHADRPEGPYAVTKLGDSLGIDPGFFADADGRLYLVVSRAVIYELEPDGLAIRREVSRLDRSRYRFFEGPSLVKRGDWYYLLFSDGGTLPREPSTISSLRARSLEGPWEEDPANPILFATDAGSTFEGPAHGTLIEVTSGDWFVAFHAHEVAYQSLGRQMLLSPVTWTDAGWWTVATGRIPQENVRAPDLAPAPVAWRQSDEFAGPELGLQWFFLGPPDRSGAAWSLRERPGVLRLRAQPGDLASTRSLPGVVQQRVTEKRFTITTRVEFEAGAPGEMAGLHLYHDPGMNLWIASSASDGRPAVVVGATDLGIAAEQTRVPHEFGDAIWLRIAVDGAESATFHFSGDGETWIRVGEPVYFGASGHHLRDGRRGAPDLGWVGRYKDRSLEATPAADRDARWERARRGNVWTATTMGLFAVSGDAPPGRSAEFDFFRVNSEPTQ